MNNAIATVSPEVVDVETWKQDDFRAQLVSFIRPKSSLDAYGRIKYYHRIAMEAGRISIAAALMTGLELYRLRDEHVRNWKEYCADHLPFSYATANRYLAVVEKSLGKGRIIDDLAHDTEATKLEAVVRYTKNTDYQSLYQLYNGEGIVKRSNLGGAGRGQGRKRRADADLAAQAEAISKSGELAKAELMGMAKDFYRASIIEGGFGDLSESSLREILCLFGDIVRKGNDILVARKRKKD